MQSKPSNNVIIADSDKSTCVGAWLTEGLSMTSLGGKEGEAGWSMSDPEIVGGELDTLTGKS